MKKETAIILGAFVIIIGLVAFNAFTSKGKNVDIQNVTSGVAPAGTTTAPLKVFVFADFQCPFCKKLADETEKNIIADYTQNGKVALYWKDFVIVGQESQWAAEAARCANDQGKFWQYHDLLFLKQGIENSGVFTKEKLKIYAQELNFSTSTFANCLDTGKYTQAVNDDTKEAQALGFKGTPVLLVGNQLFSGAHPYFEVKNSIEKQLTTRN